jgi:regulator of cell morphogenesis and NO signaling
VRTLRKPVENVMHHEHESVNRSLRLMRQLTDHYTLPEGACVSHKVILSKLLELDNDLLQHMHLENDILFPRAIAMEQELLDRKDE